MIVEIKIPSPGESVSEVVIAKWLFQNNDFVQKNQDIAEIESDKATLNLVASESGKITLLASEGDTILVGAIACNIDTSAIDTNADSTNVKPELVPDKLPEVKASDLQKQLEPEKNTKSETENNTDKVKVSPLAQKLMDEKHLSVDDIINGLQRLTRTQVEMVLNSSENEPANVADTPQKSSRTTETVKLTPLRKKLSERLVSVKNETAMLTTFNEVDMLAVMKLREKYQSKFLEKYQIKVGFMSFFIKAASQALLLYPEINAMFDTDQIIIHKYCDIGIAVQSAKGLLVPVLRNTETMSLAQIELAIKDFATKGKNNKITLDELSGGTFTITNGGTFGSLLSTPIINPPQSGILGMHNIVDRPVAINGNVEIRPMMYIALSYDHRIIDGKSAVSFLVKIKELIENPIALLHAGKNPEELVLGL